MVTAKDRDTTSASLPPALPKCPTGIQGFDEISLGGLPRERPTLICGGPGSGKTLFGMEFLIRGALEFNEPGVCISFEETAQELSRNVASLGFDVDSLISSRKLAIDYVYIERAEIEEAGEWDLEALFVRLSHAIESVGAVRVLLDSIEALFGGFSDELRLRSEIRRLFRWLKEKKLTAVITAERGEGVLTRHGLEEYISDCVILLDNRVTETIFTRRLRVVKYRGSTHGANEYPFLIDNTGFSVLPVTSLDLNHAVPEKRIPTGISALDSMLGGEGYYRGSSVLISGTAGTGKTSIAAQFVDAACSRGERAIFFSFEESPRQVVRNMHSIGIDLQRWFDKDLLRFRATRPTSLGLEMHLVKIHSLINQFNPDVVIIDSITGLLGAGTHAETKVMLLRLIDFLKQKQITALMTTLTSGTDLLEQTEVSISSLVDVWLLLRDIESGGERNRGIYVIKARGVAHSNQIREFILTPKGVELRPVYLGATGVLTGSARIAQEAQEAMLNLQAQQEADRQRLIRDRRRKAIEAQIAALQLDLETENLESEQIISQGALRLNQATQNRAEMEQSRKVESSPSSGNGQPTKPGGRT